MSENTISKRNIILKKKKSCPLHCRRTHFKYTQPERPESFKPVSIYREPKHSLESKTVYNCSYRGVDADLARSCRPIAYVATGNIQLLTEPLANTTTMNMSYKGDWNPPPEPYHPHGALTIPTNPMVEMTTQRHDYIDKPFVPSEKVVPRVNLVLINARMADNTVTKDSYMEPGKPQVLESYKPLNIYEPPTLPMDSSSITSKSYMWPKMAAKEHMPWIPDRSYREPTLPMEENTIYTYSFQPPGTEIEDTCSPRIDGVCICNIPTATEDLD